MQSKILKLPYKNLQILKPPYFENLFDCVHNFKRFIFGLKQLKMAPKRTKKWFFCSQYVNYAYYHMLFKGRNIILQKPLLLVKNVPKQLYFQFTAYLGLFWAYLIFWVEERVIGAPKPTWRLFNSSVQKVFQYTKMIIGMWRSTHVISYLVKNKSFGKKKPQWTKYK